MKRLGLNKKRAIYHPSFFINSGVTMEISKNSWHYKLTRFFAKSAYNMPSSLCPYFRYTLLSFLKVIGIIAGSALGTFCAAMALFAWFRGLSIYWAGDLMESFFCWLLFGAIAWGIAAAATKEWHQAHTKWVYPQGPGYRARVHTCPVPWWLVNLHLPKIERKERRERPYNPNSFSAVTANYIRAWHDKVCPSIKYTE